MTVLCITLNPAVDLTMNVPTLVLGKVNRSTQDSIAIAGKGLNAARILHALGYDVLVTGFVGVDNISYFDALVGELQDDHGARFEDAFVRVKGNTRTNVKLIHDQGITSDINGRGFEVTDDDKSQLFAKIDALVQTVGFDAVVVAGSLPLGFGLDDFGGLLACFDANRLAVDVTAQSLVVACDHQPWLIKPNDDELTEAFAMPAKTLNEQLELFDAHAIKVANIVVSMGAKGALWHSAHGVYQALPPKVDVVSTVGAGDTMLAAMVHGLLNDFGGQSPSDDVLRAVFGFATALSAHAVSLTGVGVPDDARLSQLLDEVRVDKLC